MRSVRTAATVAAAMLLASGAAAFEGTLRLRSTAATEAQLAKANGGSAPDAAAMRALTPEQLVRDGGATAKESTVYVKGDKVRMDLPLERDGQGYAIIDLERGLTWFVMPSQQHYIEWSAADATAMGEQMAAMQKTMDQKLAGMPPEQRKQVEAMLKGMQLPADATPGPAPAVELTPLGEQRTINGMPATGYRASEDDATVIGWVTEAHPEVAATLRQVADRMEKLTPASMRKASVPRALQQKGLPVLVQTYYPRRARIEEVVAIEPQAIAADRFTIPTSYKKTSGREAMSGHGGLAPR